MAGVFRFDSLTADVIPDVLAIENRVNTAPWSEKAFLNELQNPQSIFRLARLDGAVIGYAGIWRVVDEAHVTTIAIAPEQQRQGYGARLLREVLSVAKDEGLACSTLEVRASNEAAIRLYERFGYQIAARRKGYYPDNREDAVVMWLYHLQQWEAPRF